MKRISRFYLFLRGFHWDHQSFLVQRLPIPFIQKQRRMRLFSLVFEDQLIPHSVLPEVDMVSQILPTLIALLALVLVHHFLFVDPKLLPFSPCSFECLHFVEDVSVNIPFGQQFAHLPLEVVDPLHQKYHVQLLLHLFFRLVEDSHLTLVLEVANQSCQLVEDVDDSCEEVELLRLNRSLVREVEESVAHTEVVAHLVVPVDHEGNPKGKANQSTDVGKHLVDLLELPREHQ